MTDIRVTVKGQSPVVVDLEEFDNLLKFGSVKFEKIEGLTTAGQKRVKEYTEKASAEEQKARDEFLKRIGDFILRGKTMRMMEKAIDFSKGGAIYTNILKEFQNANAEIIELAVKRLEELKKIVTLDLTSQEVDEEDKKLIIDWGKQFKIFDARTKLIVAKKKELEDLLRKAKQKISATFTGDIVSAGGSKGGAEAPEETALEEGSGMLEPLVFDCTGFPSLVGISAFFEQAKQYFFDNGAYITDDLLRTTLYDLEVDMRIVYYGEPGDGKSLIAKTLLNWLTLQYNSNSPDSEFGKKYGANPNLHLTSRLRPEQIGTNIFNGGDMVTKPFVRFPEDLGTDEQAGTGYRTKGIGVSTTPIQLFGGYSPETIGGGAKAKAQRRKTVEIGILCDAIMHLRYVMFDELNRAENEVMDQLLGFFEEPYILVIEAANFIYKLKNSSNERSNLVIVATMNIGDIGNFKMGFAFKRRWAIEKVHYSTEQIVEIARMVKGYKPRNIEDIKDAAKKCHLNPEDMVKVSMEMLDSIARKIFDETHVWSTQKQVTQFGCGVAHIFQSLKGISYFVKDLLNRAFQTKSLLELRGKGGIFETELRKWVENILWANVFMQLVDENDKYKIQQVEEQAADLIAQVMEEVMKVFRNIFFNIEYPNVLQIKLERFPLPLSDLINAIFKF